MSKALNILKDLQISKYLKRQTAWEYREYWRDEIKEAIAELEDQEYNSCERCVYFRNSDKACFQSSQNTYIRPASIYFSGCGKFELKDA